MHLRKIKSTDTLDIYSIYSNPNVTYPAGFKPIQSTLDVDEVMAILSSNNDQAIVYNNKVIGIIGIELIEECVGMIGFLLNEHYWRQGLGTQACLLYIEQLQKLGFRTLYADCFVDNIASIALLKKLGFEYQYDYFKSFSGYVHPQQCHLFKKELKHDFTSSAKTD